MSPNKTDKFFRQALKSSPDLSPEEKDWNEMERLLKGKPDKRPVIGWIFWPAGIAAGLLIFLSVWLLRETEIQLADGAKKGSSKVDKQNIENRLPNEDGSTIPQDALPDPVNPDEAKPFGLDEIFVKL
ncbi:MAG: hypothetical protein Q7U83_01220, partial [Daejeonella sp.]|nr:hypothetical protein [Daejeonella sp.]